MIYKFIVIAAISMVTCLTRPEAQIRIPVETGHMAMVLEVEQNKDLNIIYFGKKLNNAVRIRPDSEAI